LDKLGSEEKFPFGVDDADMRSNMHGCMGELCSQDPIHKPGSVDFRSSFEKGIEQHQDRGRNSSH